MANMMEGRGNHLADIANKLAALKQSQPLIEIRVLLAEAIEDLKITLWKHSIYLLTKYKEIVSKKL